MELELNKKSFLDEFTKLKSIENRKPKDRTDGFVYIHNTTIKRLAEGEKFEVSEVDFSKFTYNDMTDYMEYYQNVLEPKIQLARKLFECISSAGNIFSVDKRFY